MNSLLSDGEAATKLAAELDNFVLMGDIKTWRDIMGKKGDPIVTRTAGIVIFLSFRRIGNYERNISEIMPSSSRSASTNTLDTAIIKASQLLT